VNVHDVFTVLLDRFSASPPSSSSGAASPTDGASACVYGSLPAEGAHYLERLPLDVTSKRRCREIEP